MPKVLTPRHRDRDAEESRGGNEKGHLAPKHAEVRGSVVALSRGLRGGAPAENDFSA